MYSIRTLLILLALLVLGTTTFTIVRAAREQKPQNVLLIVIDTLGAKHVGAQRDGRSITPHLDRLAAEGTTFTRAYSSAPWTKPSIGTMFTGLMPSSHGVIKLRDILPERATTVAERLQHRGYRTAGVVSHTLLNQKSGLAQGFEDYTVVKFERAVHDDITSDAVSNEAIRWLDGRDAASPFLLFLHYFDPHYNYQDHPQYSFANNYQGSLRPGLNFRVLRDRIPELTPQDIEYLVALYHEEIAYTDQEIGRVLDYLERNGLRDDTLIVVVADHGEEFFEHGFLGHTRTLYDELIHVPFIVSWPGRVKQQRIEVPVSLVDLTPTLLELLGVTEQNVSFDGISLAQCLVNGSCELPHRPLFAEVHFSSPNIAAHKSAVLDWPYKLISDKIAGSVTLYDRAQDPDEQRDLTAQQQPLLESLRARLERFEQRGSATDREEGAFEETPEELERLRSLGYL